MFLILNLQRPEKISSLASIISSWSMAPCRWSSLRTFSASRKEDSPSSRVEKSHSEGCFYFEILNFSVQIHKWVWKYIIERIFGCKQCSSSLSEVYTQEACQHLLLVTSDGGNGGADRQQLPGQDTVLQGLQPPACVHAIYTAFITSVFFF